MRSISPARRAHRRAGDASPNTRVIPSHLVLLRYPSSPLAVAPLRSPALPANDKRIGHQGVAPLRARHSARALLQACADPLLDTISRAHWSAVLLDPPATSTPRSRLHVHPQPPSRARR